MWWFSIVADSNLSLGSGRWTLWVRLEGRQWSSESLGINHRACPGAGERPSHLLYLKPLFFAFCLSILGSGYLVRLFGEEPSYIWYFAVPIQACFGEIFSFDSGSINFEIFSTTPRDRCMWRPRISYICHASYRKNLISGVFRFSAAFI